MALQSADRQIPSGAALPPALDIRVGATWLATPLAVFVVTRLAVLVIAYVGLILAPLNPDPDVWRELPQYPLLDGLVRWDSGWHLFLARNGYRAALDLGPSGVLVLPLYPLLVRAAATLAGSEAIAGLVISSLAFAGALTLLYRLASVRLGDEVATRAILLLALMPFAFLYGAVYAESLALLLAVGALWLAERGRFWLAAGLTALAVLTSPLGLALWPPLVLMYLQWARRSGLGMSALALALPPAALGAFLAYLRRGVGAGESDLWRLLAGPIRHSIPRDGVAGLSPVGFTVGSHELTIVLGLLLGALALGAVPAAARLLGAPYALYLLLVLAHPVVVAADAAGRDLLLAFPALVVLASLARGARATSLVTTTFATLLGLLTVLFAIWQPVDRASSQASPPIGVHRRGYADVVSARIQPLRRLGLEVPQKLLVYGYDLATPDVRPGEVLPIAVYLELLHANVDDHILMAAHLRDRAGRRVGFVDRELRKPSGVYSLPQGEVVREPLDLPVPPDVPSGVYELELVVFGLPSYARLPLVDWRSRAERPGRLQEIVVRRPEDFPDPARVAIQRPLQATLGEAVALRGFDLSTTSLAPGDELAISLYWQALDGMDRDYTVFVQMLGPDGKLIAQSDAYPLGGRFPTSRWVTGELVRDVHRLALPRDVGPGWNRVIVGMYRLDTLARLMARVEGRDGTTERGDHVVLGAVEVESP